MAAVGARSAVLLGCLVFLQCASVHAAIIRGDAINSQRLMRAMTSQLLGSALGTVFHKSRC